MTADEEINYRNLFPLGDGARREIVCFGSVDVSHAVFSLAVRGKLNDITEAKLSINSRSSIVSRMDLSSQVTVERVQGEYSQIIFAGFVVEATAEAGSIEITCSARPEFAERRVAPMATADMPAIEMIYTLARGGGLNDQQIEIQDVQTLPSEVFEVICPVNGIEVDRPIRLGSVTISPNGSLELSSLPNLNGLEREFIEAKAYAVTYIESTLALVAEEKAIQEFDLTLSWLIVRSRYSVPPLPDGSTGSWDRKSLFVEPHRGRLVYVRGIRSHRRWLRVPEQGPHLTILEPSTRHIGVTRPPIPRDLPRNVVQAILACARAARGDDGISRITALWESVEFYVGKTPVPDLFSKGDKRAIRRSIAKFDDPLKTTRIENLLADINNPPLFVRFRRRVALDGAPVSQSDVDLLSKLRKVRNDVVHGRSPREPERHEVDQGVAIVSRILVHTVHNIPGSR
ncbi:hypothetical protein GCM10022420_047850 [Streptomyces iranensis]|uniref:Apea-like HEPN domain-containing protein n=1 Tax=Streptomyces iranensis TaxID=576784 RepID=A0ABS4N1E2_9ACTN|nr:hypothetical protein [Streptomyces iranensis]